MHQTCETLQQTEAAGAGLPTVASLREKEVVNNLGVLLATLAALPKPGVKQITEKTGCNVEDLAKMKLAQPAQPELANCVEFLDELGNRDPAKWYANATTESEKAGAKLYKVLRDVVDTARKAGDKQMTLAQLILKNPAAAARFVDFSPALVAVMVQVADGAERLADDVAANVPYATGLARIALRELAAELVAAALDEVLNQLEHKGTINPASVARTACRVYDSRTHGTVASRVLRRSILRMDAQWATPASPYPFERLCTDLDSHHGDEKPCTKMIDALAVTASSSSSAKNVAPAFAPRLGMKPGDAGTPSAGYAERFSDISALTETLRKATAHCAIDDMDAAVQAGVVEPCTLQTLREIASILRVFQPRFRAGRMMRAIA